jgi:putative cardiolipin synthase
VPQAGRLAHMKVEVMGTARAQSPAPGAAMNGRTRKLATLLTASLVLTGCVGLQPVELPPEYTPPPVETPLWQAVSRIRDDNWHILLDRGPEALDWRLTAIDSAADSIDLQTFLWEWDSVGSMVMDHLIAAADRGVQIRVLIDDSFLFEGERELIALHPHPNIEYRVFNPFTRRGDNDVVRQLLNAAEFHRLDHRMHNKAMVVDNRVAFVGGRNLADEYFGLHPEANFRDLELLVGGPIVGDVSRAFDNYWNDEWSFPSGRLSLESLSAPDLAEIRAGLLPSGTLHRETSTAARTERWLEAVRDALPGEPRLYADDPPGRDPTAPSSQPVQLAQELIALFDGAQEEILVISAYLIPTSGLEDAVTRALRRGVSVKMLTNSLRSNNHLIAHSVYRNHIGTLLSAGASMHEVRIDARDRDLYMLTPVEEKHLALHAKALVIDHDRVFIGSTNLDPRSLRINTEMGLLVESETLNAAVRQAVAPNFLRANAWELRYGDDGRIRWVADDFVLDQQPAYTFMQRVEDWFFSYLPVEDEM